jgi:hypothetical protein
MGSGKCIHCNKRLSHDETFYWVDEVNGGGICADCKVKKIENERDALALTVGTLRARIDAEAGNYWSWQGDGEDHLESLTCPVVIQPHILKAITDDLDQKREALQRIGPMPTLHEGNRASIELRREDYEFIQAARK